MYVKTTITESMFTFILQLLLFVFALIKRKVRVTLSFNNTAVIIALEQIITFMLRQ